MTQISIRREMLNWACARRFESARSCGTHSTTSVWSASRQRELNRDLKADSVVNRLGLTRQLHLSPRSEKSLDEIALCSPIAVWWLSQKFARMG